MESKAPTLSIQPIRVGDLPEFARRAIGDRERYPVVPITQRRADSQIRNPAASVDDPGLLVATLGGVCVGYLGLMPARVTDGRDTRSIYCLSTFYVAPSYRKTGAGTLLIMKAASLGRDLCVVGVSDDAAPLFKAMRFGTAGPLVYLRLRIDALPVLSFGLGEASRRLKAGRLGFLSPILDAARSVLRRSIDDALRHVLLRGVMRSLHDPGRDVAALPASEVESPSDSGSMVREGEPPRLLRDDATVNWMIRHPWIGEGDPSRVDYAFSQNRALFRYMPFDLRDPGTGARLGYAVLSVSSERGLTVLKLLDRVLIDPDRASGILALVLREALRWSADVVELPVEFGALLRRSWIAAAITQRGERRHLAYTRDPDGPFGKRLSEFHLDVCDGDAPFV